VQKHEPLGLLRGKAVDEEARARQEQVGQTLLPVEVVRNGIGREQKLVLAYVDRLTGT
jgi:hypothetical protein